MATVLLDDTIVQDVLEDRRGRAQSLRQLLAEGHMLACCAPTIAEIHSRSRPSRGAKSLLDSLEYLPLTAEIAALAGHLRRGADRGHQTLSPDDALVGAVALANRCSLLTNRVSRYPINNLSLYPAIPE